MTTDDATPTEVCHFFRIPLEIRLKIYRNLLLKPSIATVEKVKCEGNLEDGTHSDTYDIARQGEYEGDFYEYNYNDSGSERDDWYMRDALAQHAEEIGVDADVGRGDDSSGSDEEIAATCVPSKEKWERENIARQKRIARLAREKEKATIKQRLAIMGVNLEIYLEASALLYSEFTITVRPGYVAGLESREDDSTQNFVESTKNVWRHNPLLDPGKALPDGKVLYVTPELDGLMYPHVFAKFQKVRFDCEFDFGLEPPKPMFFVNDDMSVHPAIEATFITLIKKSVVIQDFAKLISQSPLITHLEFDLDVEIESIPNIKLEEVSLDSDEETEADIIIGKTEAVANARATELFLECGMLDPLRNLLNIRDLHLRIMTMGQDGKPMELQAKHAGMVQSIKQTVEHNFMLRQAA